MPYVDGIGIYTNCNSVTSNLTLVKYDHLPMMYAVVIITQMLHGTGIFTYIWLKFMVNVGKYTIHGS